MAEFHTPEPSALASAVTPDDGVETLVQYSPAVQKSMRKSSVEKRISPAQEGAIRAKRNFSDVSAASFETCRKAKVARFDDPKAVQAIYFGAYTKQVKAMAEAVDAHLVLVNEMISTLVADFDAGELHLEDHQVDKELAKLETDRAGLIAKLVVLREQEETLAEDLSCGDFRRGRLLLDWAYIDALAARYATPAGATLSLFKKRDQDADKRFRERVFQSYGARRVLGGKTNALWCCVTGKWRREEDGKLVNENGDLVDEDGNVIVEKGVGAGEAKGKKKGKKKGNKKGKNKENKKAADDKGPSKEEDKQAREKKKNKVVGAHVVAYNVGEIHAEYLFGETDEQEGHLMCARNGLPMKREYERWFDAAQTAFVPAPATDPGSGDSYMVVVLEHRPSEEMAKLEGRILTFPNEFRPAKRYMYFAYVQNLLRRQRHQVPGWWRDRARHGLKPMWASPGAYLRQSLLLTFASRVGHMRHADAASFFDIDPEMSSATSSATGAKDALASDTFDLARPSTSLLWQRGGGAADDDDDDDPFVDKKSRKAGGMFSGRPAGYDLNDGDDNSEASDDDWSTDGEEGAHSGDDDDM